MEKGNVHDAKAFRCCLMKMRVAFSISSKRNVRRYNSEPNSEPDSESPAPVLKNILKKRDEQDNFNEMS
ncbi:MAG: hypothetical protein KAW93_02460 [Methanogenium sp.]|nr:hypothetical protein [Methanogenium sp.]